MVGALAYVNFRNVRVWNIRATHTVVRVCLRGLSGRHIQGIVCVYRDCQGDTYSGSCVSTGNIRAKHTGARVCLRGLSGSSFSSKSEVMEVRKLIWEI